MSIFTYPLPHGANPAGFVLHVIDRYLFAGDCLVEVSYWDGVQWIAHGKVSYPPATPKPLLLPFQGPDDQDRYLLKLKSELELELEQEDLKVDADGHRYGSWEDSHNNDRSKIMVKVGREDFRFAIACVPMVTTAGHFKVLTPYGTKPVESVFATLHTLETAWTAHKCRLFTTEREFRLFLRQLKEAHSQLGPKVHENMALRALIENADQMHQIKLALVQLDPNVWATWGTKATLWHTGSKKKEVRQTASFSNPLNAMHLRAGVMALLMTSGVPLSKMGHFFLIANADPVSRTKFEGDFEVARLQALLETNLEGKYVAVQRYGEWVLMLKEGTRVAAWDFFSRHPEASDGLDKKRLLNLEMLHDEFYPHCLGRIKGYTATKPITEAVTARLPLPPPPPAEVKPVVRVAPPPSGPPTAATHLKQRMVANSGPVPLVQTLMGAGLNVKFKVGKGKKPGPPTNLAHTSVPMNRPVLMAPTPAQAYPALSGQQRQGTAPLPSARVQPVATVTNGPKAISPAPPKASTTTTTPATATTKKPKKAAEGPGQWQTVGGTGTTAKKAAPKVGQQQVAQGKGTEATKPKANATTPVPAKVQTLANNSFAAMPVYQELYQQPESVPAKAPAPSPQPVPAKLEKVVKTSANSGNSTPALGKKGKKAAPKSDTQPSTANGSTGASAKDAKSQGTVKDDAQAAVQSTAPAPDLKVSAARDVKQQQAVKTSSVAASAQPDVPSQPVAPQNLVASGSDRAEIGGTLQAKNKAASPERVSQPAVAQAAGGKAGKKAARGKKGKAAGTSADDVEGQALQLQGPESELPSLAREGGLLLVTEASDLRGDTEPALALVANNVSNDTPASNVALGFVDQDNSAPQLALPLAPSAEPVLDMPHMSGTPALHTPISSPSPGFSQEGLQAHVLDNHRRAKTMTPARREDATELPSPAHGHDTLTILQEAGAAPEATAISPAAGGVALTHDDLEQRQPQEEESEPPLLVEVSGSSSSSAASSPRSLDVMFNQSATTSTPSTPELVRVSLPARSRPVTPEVISDSSNEPVEQEQQSLLPVQARVSDTVVPDNAHDVSVSVSLETTPTQVVRNDSMTIDRLAAQEPTILQQQQAEPEQAEEMGVELTPPSSGRSTPLQTDVLDETASGSVLFNAIENVAPAEQAAVVFDEAVVDSVPPTPPQLVNDTETEGVRERAAALVEPVEERASPVPMFMSESEAILTSGQDDANVPDTSQAAVEPEPEVGCLGRLHDFVADCGQRAYEGGRGVAVGVSDLCCAAYRYVRESRLGSWAATVLVASVATMADQATAWLSWGR